MEADRDDHGDALVGDPAGVELVQERWHEHVVRRGAGQVGDGDDGGRAARSGLSARVARQLPKRGRAEGMTERVSCRLGEVIDRSGRARFDDVDVEPGLNHELELAVPVGHPLEGSALAWSVPH
jgi:hypothetical protein